MSRLYPGLQLRIGPTINGGLMEFIIDPNSQYDERSHLLHEESTGKLLNFVQLHNHSNDINSNR